MSKKDTQLLEEAYGEVSQRKSIFQNRSPRNVDRPELSKSGSSPSEDRPASSLQDLAPLQQGKVTGIVLNEYEQGPTFVVSVQYKDKLIGYTIKAQDIVVSEHAVPSDKLEDDKDWESYASQP